MVNLKELTERLGYTPESKPSFDIEKGKEGYAKYLADQKALEEKRNALIEANKSRPWWQKAMEIYLEGQRMAGSDNPYANTFANQFNQAVEYYRNDTSYLQPSEDWSDEDRWRFGEKYATSLAEAEKFAKEVNARITQEKRDAKKLNLAEWSKQNAGTQILGSIASLGANVVGGAGYLDMLAQKIGRDDIVLPENLYAHEVGNTIQSSISQHYNEKGGTVNLGILGERGWGDVYGIGMSVAQSSLAAKTGGAAGTLVQYFGTAAAQGMTDALERGATSDQAIAYGTISGAAEALTEMISVRSFLKIAKAEGVEKVFKSVLKQAGEEAREELTTSVITEVADQWIMKGKSQFALTVNELVAQGMSVEEAEKVALKQTIGNIAYDTISGAISGGVSGGGAVGIIRVNQRFLQKDANAKAKESLTPIKDTLITEGKKYDSTVKTASKLEQKVAEGKELNGYELRMLASDVSVAKKSADVDTVRKAIVKKLESEGLDSKKAKTLGEIILKKALGTEDVSVLENGMLKRNEIASRVYNSISAETMATGVADSDWIANTPLESLRAENKPNNGAEKPTLTEKEIASLSIPSRYAKPKYEINTESLKGKIDVRALAEEDKIKFKKTSPKSKIHTEEIRSSLTKEDIVELAAIERLANALGIDFYIYESKENERGERYAEDKSGKVFSDNGFYDPSDNSIHLDLRAGENGEGVTLYTASHELVHFIKTNAKEHYEALEKLVTDHLIKAGLSLEKLDKIQRDKAIANGQTLTEAEIREEVIAEACQSFLASKSAVAEIQALKTKNHGLWSALKKFFDSFFAKINKIYKEVPPDAPEGRVIADMRRAAKKIKDAFIEGAVAAGEKSAASGSTRSEIKSKARGATAYTEYDKPITVEDIQTLRSIGRKSINNFTADDIEKAQKWAYKFYQELGTKSPFFRAWFGDWREYEDKTKLASIPVAPVAISTKDDAVDFIKQGLKARTLFRGNVENADTKFTVNIGSQVYNDTITYANRDFSRNKDFDKYKARVSLLSKIKEIAEQSILFDSATTKDENNANRTFMHYFYSVCIVENEPYLVKLGVDELNSDSTITRRAYNVNSIKITPIAVTQLFRAAGTMSVGGEKLSTYSIADLFALVKQYDKEFSPKPVNPLLLDENKQPKIFYHGTNAQFTEFDPDELADREGSFFFSESYEDASSYGSNVYEVYLHAKKWADYDNQPPEFYRLKNKKEQVEYLRERGYDGWYSDLDSGGYAEFSVFSPNQIKSATDNIGTFDSSKRNIRHKSRGTVYTTEEAKPSKTVYGYKINKNAVVNEDLLEELSIYDPDAEVDENGNITVYHRTTEENARLIRVSGIMRAKEDALFFSSERDGYAKDYGDTVIAFKIPSTELRVNDIFDGEVHFDLPLRYTSKGWSKDVSKWIVEDSADTVAYADEHGIKISAKDRKGVKAVKHSGRVTSNKTPTKNADIRHSVRNIIGASGKNYGKGVYLDSNLLTGLTDAERVQMVKEYLKELGGSVFTAYDSNNHKVDIQLVESNKKFKNEKGKRVYVNQHLTEYLKNPIKQEAIALVDELILTAKYGASEVAKHKHGWLDNDGKNPWDVWTTYIQDKENTVWKANLQIANSKNGEKILYEVHPIEMVEEVGKPDTTTTNDSLPHSPEKVNTSDENSSEKGAIKSQSRTKSTSSAPYTSPTVKSIVTNINQAYEPTKKDKLISGVIATQIAMTNAQAGIEAVAKKYGFKNIESLVQSARTATKQAEEMIGGNQYRIGSASKDYQGEGLQKIIAPIKDKGDEVYAAFLDYLFHQHNADRMSLERRSIEWNEEKKAELTKQTQRFAALEKEQTNLKKEREQYARKRNEAAKTERDRIDRRLAQIKRELVVVSKIMRKLQQEISAFTVLKNKPVLARPKEEIEAKKAEINARIAELTDEKKSLTRNSKNAERIKAISAEIADLTKQSLEIDAPISEEESRKIIEEYEANYDYFLETAEKVWKYNANLNQYRVDTGLISQEQYDYLQKLYSHYVPTYRDGANSGIAAIRGKNNLAINQSIKTATGSTRDLLDPIVIMARQTMETVRAGRINMIADALYEGAIANGDKTYIAEASRKRLTREELAELDPTELRPKNNQITYFKDGERITLNVSSEIFAGFNAFSPEIDIKNPLMMAVNKSNEIFKKLVTSWNPVFLLRNAVRDLQDAGINTKYFSTFGKNLAVAHKEIITNGKLWQLYRAMGGSNVEVFDFDKGFKGSASERGFDTRWWKKMENANDYIESIPRFTEFISSLEAGNTAEQAMLDAADVTTNFARAGTISKKLNSTVIPFLNPAIQGASKAVRNVTSAFTENKGAKAKAIAAAQLVTKAVLIGVAPFVLNAILLGDDEDYKDLRDTDKENYFLIKIGEKFVKIPRGRMAAVLAGLTNRTAKSFTDEDPDWKGYIKNASTQMNPIENMARTIFSPFLDVQNNVTWYGSAIEGREFENRAPKDRYDESTSSIAIALGKVLNYSPKKIHYILDQYSGVVGDIILPATSKKAEKDFLSGNFVIDPVTSNNLSDKFYDIYYEAQYAKSADENDKTAEYQVKHLNRVKTAVSDLYDEISKIQNSEMSDREKLAETRTIQIMINELYKTALNDYELITNAIEATSSVKDQYRYAEILRLVYGAETALKEYDEKVYERSNLLKKSGVSHSTFYTYYFGTKDIESDKDAKGNVISGSKRAKVVAEIVKLPIRREQKLVLIASQGYSIKNEDIKGVSAEAAESILRKYLRSLACSQEEKKKLAELCGIKL